MAMAIFWPFSRDLKKVREGEGVGHEDVYGKDVPDRGNSECKGPEAGMSHSEAMWLESSRAPGGKVSESWSQAHGACES